MTIPTAYDSDPHGRPNSISVTNRQTMIGRPFRKAFAPPQVEGFPPSPKETLNLVETFIQDGVMAEGNNVGGGYNQLKCDDILDILLDQIKDEMELF